jgi:hypothetical protein
MIDTIQKLKILILLLLFMNTLNADDVTYYTKGAKANNYSQKYSLVVYSQGTTWETGHAWIEMYTTEDMRNRKFESESLGFYPNEKLYYKKGMIQDEYNRASDDSVTIYVTQKEYFRAQIQADYFKKDENKLIGPWESKVEYNTTLTHNRNSFVCTSFVDRILRYAGIPVWRFMKKITVPHQYVHNLEINLMYTL